MKRRAANDANYLLKTLKKLKKITLECFEGEVSFAIFYYQVTEDIELI